LLVDDHALVRRGFRRMLEDDPEIKVLGEASDGEEAVRLALELRPAVTVMDCALPEFSGIEAMRKIRAVWPEARILMLSMHSEETLVRQAMDAGGRGYILKNALDLDLVTAVRSVFNGKTVLDPQIDKPSALKGERAGGLTPREMEILQHIVAGKSNKEIAVELKLSANTVAVHRANIMDALGIHKAAELVVYAIRHGLPETLGPGCAFLDYDNDGWQDILLINGMDWPGHAKQRSTMHLYRNNRNGTFTDVTRAAGLDVEMYGMGVAVGDFNNDGFPDIYVTCVGQSRLFQNTGKGRFVDITERSGLGGRLGFSSSALWFDYDRDGLLDLFVCNYVKWSPAQDVFCSMDAKHKSYCTPEAYRGATCWLFRNRGNGTFEDVTATSGIFDSSSKSLGVAMLDYDQDGWIDLMVANDTQPNKLYRNQRDGTFQDIAVKAGVAFSEDGKARAGMGVDVADYDNSGIAGLAITNFDNEMIGLYRVDLDGALDLAVANGHIDETVRNIRGNVGYAQAPQLFLNDGAGNFRDVAADVGGGFELPKVGRGLAFGDFDRDGDVDLLMTTNNGPAFLFRNDVGNGNRSVRFRLVGKKSNADGIGAVVRIFSGAETQSRMVRGGSSYLSQSELPVTFGVGRRERVERALVEWPSGRTEEFKDLATGKAYTCTEGTGIAAD
jgi:enediyne biosynthesis protein E4